MSSGLSVRQLQLQVENRIILKEFSLEVPHGEIHALMGPNGAGKSSLAKAMTGHPDYHILQGDIHFDGISIRDQAPDAISKLGIFLAFQHPLEIEGLSVANFIRSALQAHRNPQETFLATDFYAQLYHYMDALHLDRSFSSRALNVGFSGGEKKRCEVLQMLMLKPRFAILDEIDSGLDVDALKTVADGIHSLHKEQKMGALMITHYPRLLQYISPDRIHIVLNGKIVRSGSMELIEELEHGGYQSFSSL
ncbi:MAG: Fe-S cluster assembly ATPase SufC [Puniceicoccales bacterium]|jgi:Fe-S cluster assembly ATP-binding protein|nr:Fe-S cluster assembly ATPase SufC [Puniceicoccales bacterium]